MRWLVDRGQAVPRNPFKLLRLVWNNPRRLVNWRFLWNFVYYSSQWLLGIIGITAAIGGTAMQLMGVYSADICYITTAYWFLPLEVRPAPIISVNSAEMIRESERMSFFVLNSTSSCSHANTFSHVEAVCHYGHCIYERRQLRRMVVPASDA